MPLPQVVLPSLLNRLQLQLAQGLFSAYVQLSGKALISWGDGLIFSSLRAEILVPARVWGARLTLGEPSPLLLAPLSRITCPGKCVRVLLLAETCELKPHHLTGNIIFFHFRNNSLYCAECKMFHVP